MFSRRVRQAGDGDGCAGRIGQVPIALIGIVEQHVPTGAVGPLVRRHACFQEATGKAVTPGLSLCFAPCGLANMSAPRARETLTTGWGAPVDDNRNSITGM